MDKQALVAKIAEKTGLDQNTISSVVEALEKIVEEHVGGASGTDAASGIQGAIGKVSGLMGMFQKK